MADDGSRRTTPERLQRAVRSSDLSLKEGRRGDVDYLIALGRLHGVEQRLPKAAAGLMRLFAAVDAVGLDAARHSVLALVRRLAARRRWSLAPRHLQELADLALAHHLCPACTHCDGRGIDLMSVACRSCRGSGMRSLPRRWRDELRDTLELLDSVERAAGRAVERLLR